MAHLVAPSLLSANFLNLAHDIEMVNNSKADWFHIDVMDGHFVPNITFGFFIIEQIKSIARKPLDIHLMVSKPDRLLADFKSCGADNLTIHFEACKNLHKTINSVKDLGMRAGVVINPHTPVEFLSDIVYEADIVLLMSVNPGWGGQSFIAATYDRISRLKDLILSKNSKALIEVDGGVYIDNAPDLIKAGVDILVAGNSIFGADNPTGVIEKLKNI